MRSPRQRLSGNLVRMIYGSHFVVFSADAEADRAFLADVFGFTNPDTPQW